MSSVRLFGESRRCRQGMVRDASASCGAKDQGAGEEQRGLLLLAKENQRYVDIHNAI
ncbi:hypothetical protein [Nitrosomonas nitrosa]|uniref:hypothetical protein n=1 Tax=Nitrosomonas nitrosa TaxID=52442 RepID=UPI00195989AF|nr:hypothetical protein [Nitrosomonas nitrosa]